MKSFIINIDTIEICKKNIAQARKDEPYYGIVDICIKSREKDVKFKMIDMNDDFVAKSFSNLYSYEPFFISNWIQYLDKTKGAIIDIGASTGLYSLLSQAYARNREVYAFEPYARAFSRLISNKDINQFAKIKIYPYALADYDNIGSLSIKNFEGPITTSGHISTSQNLINIPILVKNITNVIDINKQIGQIKIDTEGFEIQVLHTLKEIIEKWKPIIFFECLTENNFKKIVIFFNNFKYDILGMNEDGKKLEKSISFNKHCTNFIATPQLA